MAKATYQNIRKLCSSVFSKKQTLKFAPATIASCDASIHKKRFYENKVSGLQGSNISRWWKDIKDLGGLSVSGDWSSQLIGSDIPDEATLALKFNEFLGSLTAHFRPLEPLLPVFGPVPMHILVNMTSSLSQFELAKSFQNGGINRMHKRLNTGMAPTCDWMIKIVKVHKLYLNSLHVSIVNRVYRSGTMKYRCENTDVSNKKWLLT